MNDQVALANQMALIAALADRLSKQSPRFAMFETHISCILVTSDYAYKFKKAVRFDFLDFSTLEARHFFCREEVRLNSRLAPDIYLDAVAVTTQDGVPVIGGEGAPLEYAVRMRAFEQEALWDYRLQNNLLGRDEIDALAVLLARFHQEAAIAPASSPFAIQAALDAVSHETLHQIATSALDAQDRALVEQLLAWDARQRAELASIFLERKAQGMIRECHGDLHSGNILTHDGQVEAFDCIEFNDSLRWIDVMNDVAFVCMDLRFRRQPELAARFLNAYLERTGDYGGLGVMRYYEVHRALIRSKVALLRAAQDDVTGTELERCRQQGKAYLAFAAQRLRSSPPALMIMHGFSGCGKSTVARQLVEAFDAIQLRSDVERKRMRGLAATMRGAASLYGADVTRETYDVLARLAEQVIRSGYRVIVDATFLQREQRVRFRRLAEELKVLFLILDIRASEAGMRARITDRMRQDRDASDAGLAVLESQLTSHEPLLPEECRQMIVVDTETGQLDTACDRIGMALAMQETASR
ncbi:MAG TPA: AAA family ATPase [Noviherbaspirillum sp.]|uniref:bifunctional aminoglycoside phosphotransferase/ATP-binding protein n=1 Tax=Noviherbaspirillum sp. TaxID=1926288 RepID=UPI002B4749F9|nr:AAA family ATPase [Noviherbaspirillum sp.]HJV85132.1 AAA family ATPase [Noviherbaspirillum sp.]